MTATDWGHVTYRAPELPLRDRVAHLSSPWARVSADRWVATPPLPSTRITEITLLRLALYVTAYPHNSVTSLTHKQTSFLKTLSHRCAQSWLSLLPRDWISSRITSNHWHPKQKMIVRWAMSDACDTSHTIRFPYPDADLCVDYWRHVDLDICDSRRMKRSVNCTRETKSWRNR